MRKATEPTEMELRVARAMYERPSVFYPSGKHGGWDALGLKNPERTRCLLNARAAIHAMREPTASMECAGYGLNGADHEGDAIRIYRAMIDAASPDEA